MLVTPSDDLIKEGNDSDYQIGPFIERGVEEEKLVSMDAVALEAPQGVAVPPEGGVELSTDSVLGDKTIKNMKDAERRVALQAHRIFNNGLKAVLPDLSKTSVTEGIEILQDCPVAKIENNAGDVFHPSAYWKELEQAGPDMDELIMKVKRVRFRAPTTTADEHATVLADLPKKRNYNENVY